MSRAPAHVHAGRVDEEDKSPRLRDVSDKNGSRRLVTLLDSMVFDSE